jgi:hypothetical protein
MNWLTELEALVARYGFGIAPDMAAMNLTQLWGLYCFLRSIAERS